MVVVLSLGHPRARVDLTAAHLHGKLALVAAGHAIALVPGVLRCALRADVATVPLVAPPDPRPLHPHPASGPAPGHGRPARAARHGVRRLVPSPVIAP